MTDWAYVTHPDLDNAGAKIPNDPLVISSYQARGWVQEDLPSDLDPDSGNGPGLVKDQKEPEPEANGPGLKALKAQPEPEPEANGPGLQDQPETDDLEINGPAGVAVLLQKQRDLDQEKADQEASRQKRSRTKNPATGSGEDQEGSE